MAVDWRRRLYGGYDAVPGGQLLNQHVVQGRLTFLHFFPFPLVVVVPFCRYFGRLRGADGAKPSTFLAPKFPRRQMIALPGLFTVTETHLMNMDEYGPCLSRLLRLPSYGIFPGWKRTCNVKGHGWKGPSNFHY